MKIVLVAAVILFTGCTLKVSPDGSREYKPDETSFLKVIKIIAEK